MMLALEVLRSRRSLSKSYRAALSRTHGHLHSKLASLAPRTRRPRTRTSFAGRLAGPAILTRTASTFHRSLSAVRHWLLALYTAAVKVTKSSKELNAMLTSFSPCGGRRKLESGRRGRRRCRARIKWRTEKNQSDADSAVRQHTESLVKSKVRKHNTAKTDTDANRSCSSPFTLPDAGKVLHATRDLRLGQQCRLRRRIP